MISTVQVGQAALLTLTTYTDGTQADQGTITIGVVDAAGTTVVAAGTAVTDNSDGTYTYSLAAQDDPNLLIVTWTVGSGPVYTTFLEVVGSILFDEYQLRTFGTKTVSNTTDYTDAAIAGAHYQACQYIEEQTGRAAIRRHTRAQFAGTGTRTLYLDDGVHRTSGGLLLPRPGAGKDTIRVLTANDGATVSTSDIVVAPGMLTRTDGVWPSATSDDPLNITVEYEYGAAIPDGMTARQGMLLAQHWLVASRVPASAQSFTDALGSYGFDQTRLPYETFQWLNQHKSVFFA